jgi:hypothetical protein
VPLEHTVQLVRIVVTILTLRVQPVLMPTEQMNVSNVALENTVQLVRTVVTILQLRVPPVLMPSERTNVSNVTLENTTTKPARQVQQVAPTVLLEHTVQLVRPVAPHVTLECTPNYLVSMT